LVAAFKKTAEAYILYTRKEPDLISLYMLGKVAAHYIILYIGTFRSGQIGEATLQKALRFMRG
jgi:hypothetical protein